MHWQYLKFFFSRTTGLISTFLGKGIQVCSIKGHVIFPSGDDSELAKIHCRHFKISSGMTGQISTKHGTKHSPVKGTQVFTHNGQIDSE